MSVEEFTDDDNDDDDDDDDDDELNVRNQPLPEAARRGSCRTRGTINNFRHPGIQTRGGSNVRMVKINNTKLRKEKK